MIRIAVAATLLMSLALSECGTAVAQQAQPSTVPNTRCGGILCDLYYRDVPADAPVPSSMTAFNPLPCHDFVCGMFGGRTPDQPPAEQIAQALEPAAAPAEPMKRKKHVARAKATEVKADDAMAVSAAK